MTTLHGLYCTPAPEDADSDGRSSDSGADQSDLRAAAAG